MPFLIDGNDITKVAELTNTTTNVVINPAFN